ncbi:hypothetical protein TWF694_007246 [Orbilia ellipsospora]|uniref:Uncharacterized protein n=1 Tax=Orbilia ellipsospora TaxID=2528407 RepID=A0AAV9XH64_9PEZI
MSTHLLLAVRLLAVLSLATTTLSAGTTYKCNSQTASMFHQDCVTAANQLVLSLTRDDSLTHIPNDDIMHSYMNCQATLQATGGEKTIEGPSLLLSFAQIGARCQDGTFATQGGTIDGTLKGVANWKRESSTIKPRSKPDKGSIWAPSRLFRRNQPDLMTPSQELNKRADMMSAKKGANGDIYRLMVGSSAGVADIAPSSSKVSSTFVQRSREFLQHNFKRTDASDLVFGNAYPISGSHVSVISLGVKLRGGQKSWSEFIQGQKDNGETVQSLIADGLTMFATNKYVAAYFIVLNNSGQQVFDFLIYGYDSVDTPVPSS